jgi:hypothetical protein
MATEAIAKPKFRTSFSTHMTLLLEVVRCA